MLIKLLFSLSVLCFIAPGCKKYLEKIPNDGLSIPVTLEDLKLMMDNTEQLNNSVLPFHHSISTDESYLTLQQWQSLGQTTSEAYTWAQNLNYTLNPNREWYFPYRGVLYANLVLEGLEQLNKQSNNETDINELKGVALFYRSFYFYSLQEMFGQPYKPSSNMTDLGIPLKLNSDFSEETVRATVGETFNRIVNDLQLASTLVPQQLQRNNLNRPSKSAVFALLSRVYLTMQHYPEAGAFADSSLKHYDALVDYNMINATATLPFRSYANSNEEVIFQAGMISFTYPSRRPTDTSLYNSYADDDLRKQVLYRLATPAGTPEFKGSYTGLFVNFAGLATDELYLNRAEAKARAGLTNEAMSDLNKLLIMRWRTGQFIPLAATDAPTALRIILEERKKELVFRGLRWSDLRRLNQDPQFAITLTRHIDGITYELPPESPRFTFPIPDEVLIQTGIPNNPR